MQTTDRTSEVTGHKAKLDALTAAERTGETDTQWWAARAPLLDRLVGPDAFPRWRCGRAPRWEAVQGPDDPDAVFRFGLDHYRYLDGLVAYIDGKRRLPG